MYITATITIIPSQIRRGAVVDYYNRGEWIGAERVEAHNPNRGLSRSALYEMGYDKASTRCALLYDDATLQTYKWAS
jgi:hypothetical protein